MNNNLYTNINMMLLAGNTYGYKKHPQNVMIHITDDGEFKFKSTVYPTLHQCLMAVRDFCANKYEEFIDSTTIRANQFFNVDTGESLADEAYMASVGDFDEFEIPDEEPDEEPDVNPFEGLNPFQTLVAMDKMLLEKFLNDGIRPFPHFKEAGTAVLNFLNTLS